MSKKKKKDNWNDGIVEYWNNGIMKKRNIIKDETCRLRSVKKQKTHQLF
jgi:hypothetical protein